MYDVCLDPDTYLYLHLPSQEKIVYTNISLGTPPQSIEVEFWMAGNECWVPVRTSHDCAMFRGSKNCNGSGGYNKTLSTSMNDLHSNFIVSKSIESSMTITGEFVTDTLVIGDTTVESMKIGILNVDATQSKLIRLYNPDVIFVVS